MRPSVLPAFFGIPTIWHDPSVSLGDSVVVIPTAQDFIKTKRLQNAPPDSLFWRNGHPTTAREGHALQKGRAFAERRGGIRGFARTGGRIRIPG